MAEIATVMYLIQPLPLLAVPLLLHLWTKKIQRIMKARRERLEPSGAEDPRLMSVNFCPTNNATEYHNICGPRITARRTKVARLLQRY